jgi:sRNA-binding carbon storage regulator CsrA
MSHLHGRPRGRVGIEAPEDVNIIRTELERKDGDSSDGHCGHKGK